MTSLLNKVRFAREGSAVERAHAHPHLMRYSVGHHSLDLITLVTLAWKADHGDELPSAQLLVACAFHDVAERATGDLPSPVKTLCPRVAEVDEMVLASLGVETTLSTEQDAYLHWGDKLELYLWCLEERGRGNQGFQGWIEYYQQAFHWAPAEHLPPAYRQIFQGATGMRSTRLSYSEVEEIAGIKG